MSTLTPTVTAAIGTVISTAKRLGHARVTLEGTFGYAASVADHEERLGRALAALESEIEAALEAAREAVYEEARAADWDMACPVCGR